MGLLVVRGEFPGAARQVAAGSWPETVVELRKIKKENAAARAAEFASKIFPDDAQAINVSFRASVSPRNEWPDDFQRCVSWFRYRTVERDGQLVGITGLTEYAGERKAVWIDWLAVDKELRGRRVLGPELLQATKAWARRRKYRGLRLCTSNPKLHNFYASAGGVAQDTPVKCDGEPIRIYNFALKGGQPEPYEGINNPDCPIFVGIEKKRLVFSLN